MTDFERVFSHQEQVTTVCVIYKNPTYKSLLQEFLWQTLDVPPRFLRIEKFLTHWKNEIRVPIVHVLIGVAGVLKPIEWNSPTIYRA